MASGKNSDESVISAHQSFNEKDYLSALRHLSDLEICVGNSNKRVIHNKALVEFMISDMKDVDKFRGVIAELTNVTFPDVEIIDTNFPCLFYNYAVLLYHSRYYYQCVVVLEKLLESKNIRDEKLLHRIVLLLMEATLCRRTYEKTLDIAKTYGESLKFDTETNLLFERLLSRAHLLIKSKIKKKVKLNLKPDTIENIFVIAQQHYLNGDVTEAVNTLSQYKVIKHNYDIKTQGEEIWTAINNNLGVIYLSLKKPFLASKYFQNAVKEHFKALENEENDRLILCRDKPLYIHNLGLALLAANNCEGAFECLVEAVRHYPNSPRIWLHLAECCVKKCCSDEAQQFSMKKLGSGSHTRILLLKENKDKYSVAGESFAIPSLSLEFAALCLRNAIALLPNQDLPSDVTAPLIQSPPGPPINFKQQCELKNSILVLQCYVLLHLQDPLSALVSANELLSQTEASNSHKAWAHIYAAEALINLDETADALEHLHPPMIHELVSVLPSQMRDMIAVSVWAKAAVSHILKGDLVTARKILLQINSPRVLPLQMYLEICTGNIENCHTILRKLRVNSISQ